MPLETWKPFTLQLGGHTMGLTASTFSWRENKVTCSADAHTMRVRFVPKHRNTAMLLELTPEIAEYQIMEPTYAGSDVEYYNVVGIVDTGTEAPSADPDTGQRTGGIIGMLSIDGKGRMCVLPPTGSNQMFTLRKNSNMWMLVHNDEDVFFADDNDGVSSTTQATRHPLWPRAFGVTLEAADTSQDHMIVEPDGKKHTRPLFRSDDLRGAIGAGTTDNTVGNVVRTAVPMLVWIIAAIFIGLFVGIMLL